MTFRRNKGFVTQRRNKTEQLISKLRNKNAKWYTAPWCGYCNLQKKVLKSIDSRLMNFIEEDTSNMPKGITGFPALYIPAQGEKEELIISGYKNEANLFKLVSQLK